MDDMNMKKEMKIEIKADENIASGIFSNYSNISHSPDEFIFDFLFIHPAPPPGFGKLRSRIIMTPSHAKKLYLALSENITEFEKRFGDIKITTHGPGTGSIQ